MDDSNRSKITEVSEMIIRAQKIAVFTGAGVSTESGIPDFRGAGGIWSRFDPEDFTLQRFLNSADCRRKQWQLLLEEGFFRDFQPNEAHRAIVDLERMEKLSCVITQNIDGLHQLAGSNPDIVLELHGNIKSLRCLSCQARFSLYDTMQKYIPGGDPPDCEKCRGILKPEVVFFGETLPAKLLKNAFRLADSCDLFIVVGSSLVVYPAAYIPLQAKESGANLVIVNREETAFDHLADVVIHGGAGEVMAAIIGEVRRLHRH